MNHHTLSGVVALALLMGISAIARAQTQAPQAAPAVPQTTTPAPPLAQTPVSYTHLDVYKRQGGTEHVEMAITFESIVTAPV